LAQVGPGKVGSPIRIPGVAGCGVPRNTTLTVRSLTAAHVDVFGAKDA
jgi:hypothetical protein